MYDLHIHTDAESDLDDVWESDPTTAARILALFEELVGNQDLLDRLTDHGYGDRGRSVFNVSKWLEQWNAGNDLWRLKIWDLEDQGIRHRIIYAFIPKTQCYHILAIAPRSFNYDSNHPISRRLFMAYEDLK